MRNGVGEFFARAMQRAAEKDRVRFARAGMTTARHALWRRVTAFIMAGVMYFAPAVLLADETARAAPIVDPRAPVAFQPTITQTSTGVPAVNIAAPNANGISANQYTSFDVGAAGLVLNNSLVSGTPLLGGTLGANPNLNGRAATTILNQVTSTTPSTLAGPLEVFGSPASVIVSNPNGISVNGLSLTNAPGLVLTTGVPQFITGPGGTPASFANAGALAYSVSSGNITINGPAGVNGPGAGIEGTVGNIDLIGQSVNLNAPLYANQSFNVITGNQTVTPGATTASGTTYGTSNVAASSPGAVAVDASQYGSVTAGQIYIVSTAAGQGVNTQGSLAATAGNVVVNSNGDITTGQTSANQNVALTSSGNVSVTGAGLANQNYTVSATGDVNATGSLSAGQNVSLAAGNNLNAALVAANGEASLAAGNSMTLGSLSANTVNLQTANGDLTVNSALTAPGTIAASAGRDLTINGAVQGGSTVTLTGARSATVNGSVSAVGDARLVAQSGSASVAGNAVTNGALDVSAGQNVAVGGSLSALGPVTITATGGSAQLGGTVVTPGALAVTAAQDVTLGGQTQAQSATVDASGNITADGGVSTTGALTLAATHGNVSGTGTIGTVNGDVNVRAGGNITYAGPIQSGANLNARAGSDATLANLSAPGAINVQAGRDVSETGDVTGGSTVALTAGRNAAASGSIAAVGDTTVTAQTGSGSVAGNVQTNGALTTSAAQDVELGGTAQAQGPVSIAAKNGSITGEGNVASSNGAVSLAAGQNVQAGGNLQAATDLSVSAGANATLGGTVTAPGTVTVTAGQNATLTGAATAGSTLTVAAGSNVSIGGAAASVGNMSLSAAAGTLAATGDVVSLGALNASGQQGVSLGGTVYGQDSATITSGAGAVSVSGTLTSPGTITVNAAQDATVAGAVHSGGNTGVNAGGNVALNGGLEADGAGNATITAGGTLSGKGAINVANNTTLTAGNSIALTGTVQTGNDLNVAAAQSVSTGAVTAVRNASVTATNGSATLGGDLLTGGNLSVTAGMDVSAPGTVQSLGDLSVNAQGGNLTASGSVSAAGSATLNAGQRMALSGQTTVAGNATLTGTNIATQALTVGGNLQASASQSLDTTAGTLAVNGAATLAGATVTTGNAIVGGAYSATGSQSLTTTGTGAYLGNATLAGGTVTNTGTQMAAGTLNVSGSTVMNTGALSGLTTASVNATDFINSGTVYGPTTSVTVANGTSNSGALMATNALTLTTRSLNNTNGWIFAGDVNNPMAATGDVTVNVTGSNGSFNNTNGQIQGFNSVTLNLANVTLDPSAATFGSVNGGNALNLSVAGITNSGTWTLPGTNVNVTASQGISNTGTIDQASGSLSLNGALTNKGTIAAQYLTVNGSLANAAGATVQGNDAFTLNGSGTNAGTVEALNHLTINGTSYDNSNGVTQAGTASAGTGNMSINLSGDLTNSGGTITATSDLTIKANNVINSGASGTGGTTTTTSTTVVNPALIMALVVGTGTLEYAYEYGGENGFCCTINQYSESFTLADALSPAGTANGLVDPGFPQFGAVLPGSPPVTTSGTVTFVEIPVTDANGVTTNAWFVQTPQNASQAIATKTVALPTVTETTTTTGGTSGSGAVIAAGHNLSLTANSLNNQAGTVSAGSDASINVQSLSNGGSTYSSTVTDTVDLASLNTFLSSAPSTISVWGDFFGSTAIGPYSAGYYISTAGIQLDAPGTVTPTSTSSSVTVQGTTGQIVAGHNVNLSGGNLTNAGTIAAGNDVNITASSFVNQGTNTGTMTSTAGCAAGYSGCAAGATTNNNSQTYSFQQINANVTAGNDLVVAANSLTNTYGNLVAGRNVVIGGAGTSASDASATPTALTQAASVTNTSGAIAAGNDVNINAAALTNTIAAPVQVHQNYGSGTPYAGCSSNCEAYVDVQSANPATITANHNVNLSAGTFANTGSLVTGLNNVTINASANASSGNQYLNAYWHANLSYYDANFPAWGCANNPSLCASLYAGAYQAAQAQDPAGLPDAVGLPDFVPGTIQAGSTLAVNSPTLTNTGNVIGQTVNLTGSTLTNGLTNPSVYTPPPAVAGQVIILGPPSVPSTATTTVNAAGQVTNLAGQAVSVTGAAGLPSNSPIGVTTVGKPVAPGSTNASVPSGAHAGSAAAGTATGVANGTRVQTVSGQTLSVTYLVNSPASAVTGDLSPAALLAQLPASLQPDTTQFYYDPYEQAQQVERAALQATGQSSFYALPSQTDGASQQTINNLDTAALYGAALQYAEQNNVALGTQLSAAQLAQINAPMLWYVEETVPEPGCTATGNGVCPTVQALMPEVLLPQNYAEVNADGTITGTNVALNYANSILNTGTVSAQNLTVNTGSLTNEQRSTNVGNIYSALADGAGVTDTTGTVVQQGGLMTAANYDLQVQSLNQIGGRLQQINADGSANSTATAQLLANLKVQLGDNFTQSTVSNNLQTTTVADQSMPVLGMVFAAVVMVAISYGAAFVGAGAIGAMAGEAAGSGGTFAAAGAGAGATGAGVGNVALSAALGAMTNSAMSQVTYGNGAFNLGRMFEAGATAFVTAGLTNGITYTNGTLGFTTQASTNSLAALAGVQAVGGVMVPTATAAAGDPVQAALALAAVAGMQAGTQTAIEGGSLLTNLRNDAVSDMAASANYAIGSLFGPTSSNPNLLASIASHAVLGCAAGAASGEGCGGGAVGAAASAALSPYLASAMDPTGVALTQGQQAVLAAFATAVGGTAAALTGTNIQGAISQAQNEALNNSGAHIADETGGKPGQQSEGIKFTEPLTPPAAPVDEEQAGAAPTTGQNVVAVYGPLNPGPLAQDIANTFRSGTYSEVVAQQPTTLYRVYGGTANQMGGYWTLTPSAGPVQSIIDSALLPQWGNTATNMVKIEIPAGTTYFTGAAAPQGGLVGGGSQVVFSPGFRVDPSWIKTP